MPQARNPSGERRKHVTSTIASIRARYGLIQPAKTAEPSYVEIQAKGDVLEYQDSVRFWLLVYDLGRMHRNAFDAFMEPLGIDRAQWFMLAQLSREDGLGQMQLADMLEMQRAKTGIVIAKLEAAGWVERRDDPVDSRIKRVYLVKDADIFIRQMLVLAGQFSERILSNVSKAQRAEIGCALTNIKHEIENFDSNSVR